jgi:hypothetical protein
MSSHSCGKLSDPKRLYVLPTGKANPVKLEYARRIRVQSSGPKNVKM